MLALVSRSHNAALCGHARRLLPQRRDLDGVDTVPPRIPRRELGLGAPPPPLEAEQAASGKLAHMHELRLDGTSHVVGQSALEVGAQDAVGGVLIAENGRVLEKGHRSEA